MAGIHSRNFDAPDESRTPDKTRVDVVHLAGKDVARLTLQPGWRWSECIKPVAQTESCQADHVGYVAAGHLVVEHEDGSRATLSPGDAYRIAPGHDAWVEGEEAFVGFEFQSAAEYARG